MEPVAAHGLPTNKQLNGLMRTHPFTRLLCRLGLRGLFFGGQRVGGFGAELAHVAVAQRVFAIARPLRVELAGQAAKPVAPILAERV